jgi:hypothetical protein
MGASVDFVSYRRNDFFPELSLSSLLFLFFLRGGLLNEDGNDVLITVGTALTSPVRVINFVISLYLIYLIDLEKGLQKFPLNYMLRN